MEPVAVIGLSCRLPGGSRDPHAFWHLLQRGSDAITEIPADRRDLQFLYKSDSSGSEKARPCWGGFLEKADEFDANFFKISPKEAECMDPQQRLVMEVMWEALENAAIDPAHLAESLTGVFIGASTVDYNRLVFRDKTNLSAYAGTGTAFSVIANRISYFLDLRGPSVAIDTACSSSLVAVHLACQSLQSGESQLCLVGGVNSIITPEPTLSFAEAQMMSADGRCKTFDAAADGYVRGEGCGIVVLKRLSDALKDNDRVLALIPGSAINQDGHTNGLTAPNGPAQQTVIRQALANAAIEPGELSYIETHGTGTSLGDPIEVRALKSVLLPGRSDQQTCWLGSVKTNIGHLEAAAGVAGLIKVVLALQHEEIPPNLHLKQLNPLISLGNTPLKIPTQPQPWPRGERQRVAGVSSFGFGGTNAHVIVAEAPLAFPQTGEIKYPQTNILTLSAKTEDALDALIESYTAFFASNEQSDLNDVCFTANVGRADFECRLAVISGSISQMQRQLDAVGRNQAALGVVRGSRQGKRRLKRGMLFTGQGSQYIGMAKALYEMQPIFKQTLDQCADILDAYLDQPLLQVLYPQTEGSNPSSAILHQTAYTQPALFALEYALYQLWQSWGVQPTVVMGHSVGEYVAACVAGIFSLEDGLKLIAARGQLMQQLPAGGAMVSLMATVTQAEAVIAGRPEVAIAALNGPQSTVISGPKAELQDIVALLELDGIKNKFLNVSHAFHSPLMQPMLAEFERVAQQISYSPPRIPLISNVTGQLATDTVATPEYWCQHILAPVNFALGIKSLQQTCDIFLECGPTPTLLGMGQQCLPVNVGVWVPSLRPGYDDWQQMLTSLGELYVRGLAINWQGVYQDASQRLKVALPTYPFQRQRYWYGPDSSSTISGSERDVLSLHSGQRHPILGYRLSPPAPWAGVYIWDVVVDETYLTWLKDHQVWHTVIMPHTGYLQIALEATQAAFQEPWNHIANLKLYYPLFLSSQGDQRVQVVLTPQSANQCHLQIYSCRLTQRETTEDWTLYADASISKQKARDAGHPKPLKERSTISSARNGTSARITAVHGEE